MTAFVDATAGMMCFTTPEMDALNTYSLIRVEGDCTLRQSVCNTLNFVFIRSLYSFVVYPHNVIRTVTINGGIYA